MASLLKIVGIGTPGSERHRKAKIDKKGQVSPVTRSERRDEENGGDKDGGGWEETGGRSCSLEVVKRAVSL